jgi:hypothetical protein
MKNQWKLAAVIATTAFLSIATITNGVLLSRSSNLVGTSTKIQTQLNTGAKTPAPRTDVTPAALVVAIVITAYWAVTAGIYPHSRDAQDVPSYQPEEMLDALP